MLHEDRARKGIDTASFRKRFAQIVSALHSAGCGRTRPGVTSRYSTDRFIGDLDRALMRLTDPKDIVAVTVRTLGHYLGLDRCVYAEVEADQDHVQILRDHTRAATNTFKGRYRMSDFGIVLDHQAYVVNDLDAEPPPRSHVPLFLRSELRSFVYVPLIKDGIKRVVNGLD